MGRGEGLGRDRVGEGVWWGWEVAVLESLVLFHYSYKTHDVVLFPLRDDTWGRFGNLRLYNCSLFSAFCVMLEPHLMGSALWHLCSVAWHSLCSNIWHVKIAMLLCSFLFLCSNVWRLYNFESILTTMKCSFTCLTQCKFRLFLLLF